MPAPDRSFAFASTRPAALRMSGAPVAVVRRRVLEGLFGDDSPPPTQVGRFELREPVGRGCFGTVWRGFDPVLRRDVAIKIIDSDELSSSDQAVRRFLQEARTVAGLRSEYVVEVYDCGVVDGSPYLAMELMTGGSVDQWLQQPRPWLEVLEVFIGAGRGLAAAHAAGVVHCDFKPANVLLTADGRPCVADFGLAVLADPSMVITDADSADDTVSAVARGGTPAFMAPEQHMGEPVDARSDVYAFCASLHAGLHGRLPFEGRSLVELVFNKTNRRIMRGSGSTRVPRWLQAVVTRGLAPDRRERWPSMQVLVDRLEQGPSRTWRRGLVVTGLGVGLVALALVPSAPAPGCEDEARVRAETRWNAEAQHAVQEQLAARPGLADDVTGRLDEHRDRWVRARAQACGSEQGPRLDARMRCLDDGLDTLGLVVDRLRRAPPALDQARQLVRSLGEPGACSQGEPMASVVDPAVAAAAEALRAELRALRVAHWAGELAAEVERAAGLVPRARAAGDDALEAEAHLLHGRAQQAAGSFEEAADACEQAHWVAARVDHQVLALESALCVARMRGVRLGQVERGLDWARQAEVALGRAGRPELEAGRLEDIVASIHWAGGDVEAALPRFDRAIERYERASPPSPRLLAATLNNRANAYMDLGRHSEAVASLRRAAALIARELGEDHVQTAIVRCSLGSALGDVREPAAITELEGCLGILRQRMPADHVSLVQAQANLGLTYRVLGDPTSARANMEEALEAARTVPGQDGVDVRVGIGTNLGDLLLAMGEPEAAQARFEAARVIAHDELGREDPRSLRLEIEVAKLEATERASRAAAGERLEQAVATAIEHEHPDFAAMARFELARLVEAEDPAGARVLAEAALAHWRQRGPGRSIVVPFPDSVTERVEQVEAWLARR